MVNLAIVCSVLVVLPFLLSALHNGWRKPEEPTLVAYRYFATFNMLLAGIFVGGRMFLNGPQAAIISGWAYSPMFHLYGIALFSMSIMAFFTLYRRNAIMLAPAICWSVFLLLSTVSHVVELEHHEIGAVNIIYVHIIYNLVVSGVLLYYIYQLRTWLAYARAE